MSRATGAAAARPVPTGGERWLPLLVHLRRAAPDSVVWKNADDALAGTGDVDLAAPGDRWPVLVEAFRRWAASVTPHPVVVCRHVPFAMLAVAVDEHRPSLLQLDVRDRVTFRGSTLFRAGRLEPLSEIDPRGFRRLRPGAEGLLKLVQKGLGLGGRPKWDRLRREHVADLLRSDPPGAALAAGLIGAPSVLRGAAALVEGGWDRTAMLRTELSLAARAVREPATVQARLRFRADGTACPVVRATTRHGRRVPEPVERWIATAVRQHHGEEGS